MSSPLRLFVTLVVLFLLQLHCVKSYDVSMEVTDNTPKLCFTSADIVPKYVNAICKHRNRTYIGGMFNRVGNESAQHFAVLNEFDELSYIGRIGMDTTLQHVLESTPDDGAAITGKNASFLGLVTALACPEDDDYVYIGGIFSTVGTVSSSDQVADEHGDQMANNIVRFNVKTWKFEPLKGSVSLPNNTHVGMKKFCDEDEDTEDHNCDPDAQVAMVRTLECASNGGRSCDVMFVGG